MRLNLFDKICAVLAFGLGVVLLILGLVGVIFGCNAHFTLPPILGALPVLFGWGIVKPVIVAWKAGRPAPDLDADRFHAPPPYASGGPGAGPPQAYPPPPPNDQ